jgi:hypothetical protein
MIKTYLFLELLLFYPWVIILWVLKWNEHGHQMNPPRIYKPNLACIIFKTNIFVIGIIARLDIVGM